VAIRLSVCYPYILNQSDPPVLGGSNETRHVTNKSSESKDVVAVGDDDKDGWVRVLIITKGFAGSLTRFLCSSKYSSLLFLSTMELLQSSNFM
jgi:hypothetical protein